MSTDNNTGTAIVETETFDINQLVAFAETSANQIEQHLGTLYDVAQSAGDKLTTTNVRKTWEHVLALRTTAETAIDTAITAKELAKAIQEQRDQALDELKVLVDAVDSMDYDHPKVGMLLENAEEEFVEHWMDAEEQELYDSLFVLIRCAVEKGELDNRTMTDDGRPASLYQLASRLQEIIDGKITMNDTEEAAFRAFILSMTEEAKQ